MTVDERQVGEIEFCVVVRWGNSFLIVLLKSNIFTKLPHLGTQTMVIDQYLKLFVNVCFGSLADIQIITD